MGEQERFKSYNLSQVTERPEAELEPKTFEPTDPQPSAAGGSLDRNHGEGVNLCWGEVSSCSIWRPGYMIIFKSTSPELGMQMCRPWGSE